MNKVVISCGPIPARLDSVKFLTNKFKGGLSFKTAFELKKEGFDITIVKWLYTELPENLNNCKVINVNDVYEYYNWYKENAKNYNTFIMSAAVANLSPSNPYEGKFPSHNYKVGEKFNIEFEIAPRAIDIIKKENPRCCLIGYKLFDARTDDELIEIAKHTLKDSKANIIFANTPKDAKLKKIALFQDDTNISVNFDEHINLIIRAINQEYFKTEIINIPLNKINKINLAFEVVKNFEKTIDGYGTIGIKISEDGDFVTTSRGHCKEPVYIEKIDILNKTVYASNKATLNAPVISAYLKNYEYFIHRHEKPKNIYNSVETLKYLFPGTLEEYNLISESLNNGNNCIYEKGHGYLKGYNYKSLDWNNYYNLFPKKYFSINEEIEKLINDTNEEDYLDVGCNINTKAKYYIDPFITLKDKIKLEYDDLTGFYFSLITLNNSINYLSKKEIEILINSLSDNGILIANTFFNSPDFRLNKNEAVYKENNIINHYLIKNEENVYFHKFFETDLDYLKKKGFEITKYGTNSILLKYRKVNNE